MTYTAISLFSGAVDGLAIAAQAAGITVTHHIEWDAWCCRVLRMNHPESIVLNKDIHDVHDLPPTDIIFGGSPCQDFSNAGNGAGFAGSRYLWPEMFRIVRANRPRVVIHENVRGGVSKGLLDRISDDLESAGYETTALVFPACVFGAPHERYRMFHIGLLADAEHNGHTTTALAGRDAETVYDLAQGQDSTGQPAGSDNTRITSGQIVGNASSAGFYESEQPNGRAHDTEIRGGQGARLERFDSIQQSERLSQSRLGSAVTRPTPALHRLDPLRDFPGWPAGQGAYQHAFEPARTTKKPGKYAKERIQAHGNAVVWPQAAPIFRAIVRWLDEG